MENTTNLRYMNDNRYTCFTVSAWHLPQTGFSQTAQLSLALFLENAKAHWRRLVDDFVAVSGTMADRARFVLQSAYLSSFTRSSMNCRREMVDPVH